MNKFGLARLAAKDALLMKQKWAIRYWPIEDWAEAVEDLAARLLEQKDQSWRTAYGDDV